MLRLKRWSSLALVLAALLVQWVGPAQADGPTPDPLADVSFETRLNEQVPLDLQFRDETGQAIHLGNYFGDKPVILVLYYYRCRTLCGIVLNTFVETMYQLDFNIGDEFNVVTVSIDETETPALAAEKKAAFIKYYNRPGAAAGWHFLTGANEQIKRLADAVGFHYVYDAETDQFSHPVGIMVLTPQGRISNYFYGIDYPVSDVRLALVGAADSKIGTIVDKVLLLCYHYDPVTGKYGATIMTVMRLMGFLTVVAVGGYITIMLLRENGRKLTLRG
jgi:protein SCO1/2